MNKLHAGWNTVLQPLLENLSSVNDEESKNRLDEINAQLEKNMNQRTQLNNLFMKQYLDTEAWIGFQIYDYAEGNGMYNQVLAYHVSRTLADVPVDESN